MSLAAFQYPITSMSLACFLGQASVFSAFARSFARTNAEKRTQWPFEERPGLSLGKSIRTLLAGNA